MDVVADPLRVGEILQRRRAELDAGARLLLERETITPEEFPPLRPQPTP